MKTGSAVLVLLSLSLVAQTAMFQSAFALDPDAQTAADSTAQPSVVSTQPATVAPAPVTPASTRIKPGDKVYIQPGDFGMALTAAILKKKVPVSVVDDSTKADFNIQTTSSETHEKTGVRIVKILALGAGAGSGNHFDATVTAKNRDGVVIFAYNSRKENFQSAAQNVAKNLKKHIEGK